MIWSVLTGGITSLVDGWFKTKQKQQEATQALAIKKLAGSDDYDIQAQKNMGSTLKDEYLIVIHSFLIWGYIIPSETLTARLDILWGKLDSAPLWWQVIYGGMVISTFGLRFMSDKITPKK